MDNFDLRNFLAEGKLHEETEALDRESVIDMAQMVADEFTEEDANVGGTHMIYKVGKIDGLGFELDTQATENTPADDAKYGTGEGWGGSFRIEVLPNGYEIRNSEKGGLVATMDMEDGFRMLSPEESRAELLGEPDVDYKNDELDMKRMEEGEAPKSNKMKKSELKEMIRTAMLAEMEVSEDVDMIPAEKLFALIARDLKFSPLVQDGAMLTKEQAIEIMRHVIAIEGSDISAEAALGEYIANGDLNEAETTVSEAEEDDIEAEIEADDVDVDIDADVDMNMGSEEEGIDVKQDADTDLGGTVGDVQDNLEAALEAARELGDEKLEDQIGNTLTFFTRQHVVK